MKISFKNLKYIVFCMAIMFIFGGCGKKLYQIRYDVPSGATTLDPQYAKEDTAKIVIANTYEGLMRKTAEGEIVSLGAESYTVSKDGLVYTFNLRKDMKWSDGSSVVADDFVFTFERIFNSEGDCPYSNVFSGIKNSKKVLGGNLSPTSLGVKAIDDNTVEFTLEVPDSMFIEKLTKTSAVPTNRSYFKETKGKYGMDNEHIFSNGPFEVRVWDNSKYIILKRAQNYYDKSNIAISGMNIHIGRTDDKLELIKDDKADAFPASYSDVMSADKKYISYEGFNNKIWTVARNPKSEVAELGIKATDISEKLHGKEITNKLPENMVKVFRLLPESSKVGDLSYTKNSKINLKKGLYNGDKEEIRRVSLIIYDNESIRPICDYISQVLQREYSLYADIKYVNSIELLKEIVSGEYDLAIFPMTPETSSPSSILYDFVGSGSWVPLGFDDNIYSGYVFDEENIKDNGECIKKYETLEQSIINSGIIAPLYSETDYFISSNRINGIEFYPYSNIVYIKNAVSK